MPSEESSSSSYLYSFDATSAAAAASVGKSEGRMKGTHSGLEPLADRSATLRDGLDRCDALDTAIERLIEFDCVRPPFAPGWSV